MNRNTQRIKQKGYTLPEGLKLLGISLSTYRRYEKEDSPYNSMLVRLVDELERK